MKQLKMAFANDFQKEFGGSLLLGKRKTARPLATKDPILLTLKSTTFSPFNPTNRTLEKIIKSFAAKYDIKIYNFAINWNHIHMVMKLPSRAAYFAFIKTVTAALVSYLSKALGKDLRGLFDLRPHTKILTWGKQFKAALDYMILNQQEALGLIKRVKKSPKKKKP